MWFFRYGTSSETLFKPGSGLYKKVRNVLTKGSHAEEPSEIIRQGDAIASGADATNRTKYRPHRGIGQRGKSLFL